MTVKIRSISANVAACLALLIVFLPFDVSAQTMTAKTPEDRLKNVMEMASQERFDTALFILDYFPEEEKDDYGYLFTKARILSWSGNYQEAGHLYADLRRQYPGDQDILVGSAFLEFYQGNLERSEYYFQQVVDVNPSYTDAFNGLRRVQNMRASAARAPIERPLRAEACPQGYTLASDGRCLRYTQR